MVKKLLILVIVMGFLVSSTVWAEEIKQEEVIKSSVIIPLKVEGLKWKLKYYQEKALSSQLRAMIQLWNNPEFQSDQKIIRKTDQEIKHLLLK